MNTITGSEKGDNLHKVPKGYYYDTGGNLAKTDPSKPDMTWSDWADPADETTTWNPQTWFPNLGGGPESEEGKNKRIAALNKKKQAVAAGPKTPKSIKPSNTEPLSTQLSNTKESKTFKNYLDEVYSQGRSNAPIQPQGSVGSKRPTVAGNKAKMTDIDAGKGQPDQYMTTITKINPSTGEEEVIDQSNPHSSATAMRIKNAQSVANRTGARQRIMKA
jgi:hypothetical protein